MTNLPNFGTFCVTNFIEHAYEHPFHNYPQKNLDDYNYIVNFSIPMEILHGFRNPPRRSNPFCIKWFERGDMEWKEFCIENVLDHWSSNHRYDIVIGPSYLPSNTQNVTILNIDIFASTQNSFCIVRTWEWMTMTMSVIYMEKHQSKPLSLWFDLELSFLQYTFGRILVLGIS